MNDQVSVRCLEASEAPLLVACIRQCYGETYIDPAFYDAGEIARRISQELFRSIVAVNGAGEVIGHMGISFRRAGDITADAGMTLVDPRYRGRKIARAVALELAHQSMALGLVAVHDYPVTVHGATQRLGAEIGVESGLMLSNMPADTTFRNMDAPNENTRSASLIRYLPMGQAPEREVFLPGRYAAAIRRTYVAANLVRREIDARMPPNPARAKVETHVDERRGVRRISVQPSGHGLGALVEGILATIPRTTVYVTHTDLRLSDPRTPLNTEELRSLGFFFAGILPEFRDGDVLRLQLLHGEIEESAIPVLENDSGHALRSLVLEDARDVGSERQSRFSPHSG